MIDASPVNEPCRCYRCGQTRHVYTDDGDRRIANDLHDQLRECEECGHAKTEWVDHFRWGEYECWWCTERAAGTTEIENLTNDVEEFEEIDAWI